MLRYTKIVIKKESVEYFNFKKFFWHNFKLNFVGNIHSNQVKDETEELVTFIFT